MDDNAKSNDTLGNKKGIDKPVFITQSSIMKELVGKIKLAAKTKAPILISGESGTGKEVLARLVHYYSSRNDKDIVAVNCGAIPPDLVESELFGHEKGAFTGASERKEGCFELADKSTLFLDEIGEMPKDIQVKLLRAVELSAFRRVGGKKEINVDTRIVSATNKKLIDQISSGNFREDLYYRLDVIELDIPPLRKRRGDIPLLINYYKNDIAEAYQVDAIEISDECMGILRSYDWPGNVRELKNVVERCVVLHSGKEIGVDSIPAHIKGEGNLYSINFESEFDKYIQIPIGISLAEVERKVISHTLNSVDNNKTEASKILGFSRKTLHNKLERYATKG